MVGVSAITAWKAVASAEIVCCRNGTDTPASARNVRVEGHEQVRLGSCHRCEARR